MPNCLASTGQAKALETSSASIDHPQAQLLKGHKLERTGRRKDTFEDGSVGRCSNQVRGAWRGPLRELDESSELGSLYGMPEKSKGKSQWWDLGTCLTVEWTGGRKCCHTDSGKGHMSLSKGKTEEDKESALWGMGANREGLAEKARWLAGVMSSPCQRHCSWKFPTGWAGLKEIHEMPSRESQC